MKHPRLNLQDRLKFLRESNYPPTDNECIQILQLIAKEETKIKNTDRILASAQAIIEKFTVLRSESSSNLIKYRSVLSPIRRIPPEIIREIFLHVMFLDLDSYECDSGWPTWPRGRSPFLPSQICSTWRQIASDCLELWRRADIVLSRPHFGYSPTLSKTWMDKAQALPLIISIRQYHLNYRSSYDLEKAVHMMADFLPYLSKCSRLRVDVDDYIIPHCLSTIPKDAFNLLEHLELVFVSQHIRNIDITWAPRLKSVKLLPGFDTQSHSLLSAMAFSWSQLVDLEMRSPYVESPFILKQLVNLEKYTVDLASFANSSELAATEVILPRLWYLRLIHTPFDPSYGRRLLNVLTLPKLRSLNFGEELPCEDRNGGNYLDYFPVAQILDLQARSGFDLITLSFNNTCVDPTQFRDILRVTPSLVSLSLIDSLCQRDFLKALTYTPEDMHPLVPKLQELSLIVEELSVYHHASPMVFNSDDLADLLESRWWVDCRTVVDLPVVRLQKVKVILKANGGHARVLQVAKRCRKEGLNVRVEIR